MGAYLAHPITATEPQDGSGNGLEFGASSMQGWRVSQEDAHNCIPHFDKRSSFFGVYDGHGGSEVAVYLSQHLPQLLKETDAYRKGDWGEALKEAYLKIDESIKSPEVLKEIVRLSKFGKSVEEVDGHEDENVSELYEEATMPIEMLVAKYKEGGKSLLQFMAERLQDDSSESVESSESNQNVESDSDSPSGSSKMKSRDTNGESETESPASSKISHSHENKCETSSKMSSENLEKPCPSSNQESLRSVEEEAENSKPNSTPIKNGDVDTEGKQIPPKSNGHVAESGNGVESILIEEDILSFSVREESVLIPNEEPKKRKGKVHPPPTLKLPPVQSLEKRTSPRKKPEALYNDFLKGESSNSEESEDEDDPTTLLKMTSDSEEESEEAEEEANSDSSSSDNDVELEEEEDEEEEDDDEMLKDIQEPGYDSGATAVTAFLRWEGSKAQLWVANAGDSRCVVSRKGVALEMSQDHKPEDEGEALRIVTAGGKVTAEGRVNGGLNLSRAIGDHSYKTNPTLGLAEQMITPLPDLEFAELEPEVDEFLILACDGIWNSMTSQQVVNFIRDRIQDPNKKLSAICDELFHACLASDTGGDGTGCDNMTAIIVKLTGKEEKNDSDVVSETPEAQIEKEGPVTTGVKRPHEGSPVPSSSSTAQEEAKRIKVDESVN